MFAACSTSARCWHTRSGGEIAGEQYVLGVGAHRRRQVPAHRAGGPPLHRGLVTTVSVLGSEMTEKPSTGGSGVGKDQRRVYTCPQCNGAQVITTWKRADLDGDPETQEIQTTEDCPTCDGSGQILGPPT